MGIFLEEINALRAVGIRDEQEVPLEVWTVQSLVRLKKRVAVNYCGIHFSNYIFLRCTHISSTQVITVIVHACSCASCQGFVVSLRYLYCIDMRTLSGLVLKIEQLKRTRLFLWHLQFCSR